MRLTVRHYYDFGPERRLVGATLDRPESWDALRLGSQGPFALPADADEWARLATDPVLQARAAAIERVLREWDAHRVASYGAGTGALELCLSGLRPDLELVVADNAPQTVERLGDLFKTAEVKRHDLGAEPPLVADAHLLNRVDSEFDDPQLRAIFERFGRARLVVVATEILGARALAREGLMRVRRGATRAGWVRNRGSFEALWERTHDASRFAVNDLAGWALEPRQRPGVRVVGG